MLRNVTLLHTMLRVGDLDRSLAFYVDRLGMKLHWRKDFPSGRFTIAFIGYTDEVPGPTLELTHNWDRVDYDKGDGYGHIALGVEDVSAACAALAAAGIDIPRPPAPMNHGGPMMAFLLDPDGYRIELIQQSLLGGPPS